MKRMMMIRRGLASMRESGVPLLHSTKNCEVYGMPVGPMGMNQMMVACTRTKKAAIVDAGDPMGSHAYFDKAKEKGYDVEVIWQTHAHIDHVLGLVATKESIPDAQVFLHPEDSVWYESLSEQAKRFGLNSAEQPEKWDVDLSEGDVMELGELRFDVMHTPGHAPGHCCFLEKSEGVLLAGDLLFKGSIGRTDLPFCDERTMMQSLSRMLDLNDDVVVFPGHMDITTIGDEKKFNPFLRAIAASR